MGVELTGSTAALAVGTYSVTMQVTDGGGLFSQDPVSVTVAAAPPPPPLPRAAEPVW